MDKADRVGLAVAAAVVLVAAVSLVSSSVPPEAAWSVECELFEEYERPPGNLAPGPQVVGVYDERERVEKFLCPDGTIRVLREVRGAAIQRKHKR